MKKIKTLIKLLLSFTFFINININTFSINLPSEKLHNQLIRMSYKTKTYIDSSSIDILKPEINRLVNFITDKNESQTWSEELKMTISKIYLIIPYLIVIGGKELGYSFLNIVKDAISFKQVTRWIMKNIPQCKLLRAEIKEEIKLMNDIKLLDTNISKKIIELTEILVSQKFKKSALEHKKIDNMRTKRIKLETRLSDIRKNKHHHIHTDIINSYYTITSIMFI